MRKLVAFSMISLDGVLQAPGGPDEDPSGGFRYGGWTAPYGDPAMGKVLEAELREPFDLLLGRKTYDIWAPYWPQQQGPIADPFNAAKKYVAAGPAADLSWPESIRLGGDVAAAIRQLKEEGDKSLHLWGSGQLLQTLFRNDLVDELRLRIHPLTLGEGKRLFAGGSIPAAFELIDTSTLPTGVILANYRRAGEVVTGSAG